MKFINLLNLLLLTAVVLPACQKNASTTLLHLQLTDGPASYEEVNIDVQEVHLKLEGDSASWISLPTNKGIYNLLELQNGIDTLVAEAIVPQGRVKEIRLTLGHENSIKEGGEWYPLTIPSGSESGLKIKLDKQLTAPLDSIIIDFDAALSIHQESGGYKLRPVIKWVQ